jgi:hypothetical protein
MPADDDETALLDGIAVCEEGTDAMILPTPPPHLFTHPRPLLCVPSLRLKPTWNQVTAPRVISDLRHAQARKLIIF